MKYLKFCIATLLAISLVACSDSSSCDNETALEVLQDLQKQDAIKFQNILNQSTAQSFLSGDVDGFWSNAIGGQQALENLKSQGITFSKDKRKTDMTYSSFTTQGFDENTKKRSCLAEANGTIDLGKLGSVTFKNFSVTYQVQPTDDGNSIYVWLLNTLTN